MYKIKGFWDGQRQAWKDFWKDCWRVIGVKEVIRHSWSEDFIGGEFTKITANKFCNDNNNLLRYSILNICFTAV
ncbi:MAG: hypothetical protein R3Y26_11600, partial [Rikenellaceae bacterium]